MQIPKILGSAGLVLLLLTGCATRKQAKEMDAQLDLIHGQLEQLLENTRRDTLQQIFGEQSAEILTKVDELDASERDEFNAFLESYQRGNAQLEDVRSGMVTLLGGGEREVASPTGIWVRDQNGEKLEAIGRGHRLTDCHKLADDAIPAAIGEKSHLSQYQWGSGQLEGQQVIFPWDFTMSSFTKEIVENTARRTAEEMRKMAGDGEFNRPIYIQVTTDPAGEGVQIKYPAGEGDIHMGAPPTEE